VNKVKLPKSLKVGGYTYRVLIDGHITRELLEGSLWGEHSPSKLTLKMDGAAPPQHFHNTAIHELIHAANEVYLPKDSRITENQVQQVSNGLAQILNQLGLQLIP